MTGARTVVTGLGLAVEDRARGDFTILVREAADRGGRPWVAGESAPDFGLPSAKDRKILNRADVLAARAASRAIDDAFPRGLPDRLKAGCIAFGCGSGTCESELEVPFVGFHKPSGDLDSEAFARAVVAAEVQVDPLSLLRTLNNNVVWWLTKRYGLGDTNLQITQSDAPDLWALISAVDLIESGECDVALVGGVQTIEQSAILLTGLTGRFCPDDAPRAGGAAVFFVLERGAGQRHDAELRLRLDSPHLPVTEPLALGAPAMLGALDVYRACLAARARGAVALLELGRPT